MEEAQREISKSLLLSKLCMRCIGLSFDTSKDSMAKFRQNLTFLFTVCAICYHVFSEIAFIGLTLSNSPKVEEVAPLFHTFGYGFLSIAKVFVLWYKKDVFRQLIEELAGIWPVPPLDAKAEMMKDLSLAALRLAHQWYFSVNMLGLWFYNLTPIGVYIYKICRGEAAKLGYVWVSWYPFDKHQPLAHVVVYMFEMYAGQACVWIMIGTDLLFTGMASHISLLLRLLQKRLEALAQSKRTNEEYYDELLTNIKLHQRLIRYCNDIEEAFSFSNLINIVMSSINISCVVFVIVLIEPFIAVNSKLFLVSALLQIGVLCWYGDDILHANGDIAISAYNNRWYLTDEKCRRALMFLIVRAQKPIAFTAWKITNMSLVTYSAILTRSYSYFALLYTMYSDKN